MLDSSMPGQHGAFDPGARFVKVREINPQGFVEFDFAIGAPELCVELMLTPDAFEEFCLEQKAVRLDIGGRFAKS